VDKPHSETPKPSKKEETQEYQGSRALWVLREFCDGIKGNMENCQEYLDKFKPGKTRDDQLAAEQDNNIVAVQKMAYGSCLNLLRKLKKDYDDEQRDPSTTAPDSKAPAS